MRLEPTVTLVNRLRDADGNPIRQEYMYDGESVVILDKLVVPEGAARIIVHNSMFKVGADVINPEYKLGVPEWGLPTEPIRPDEFGDELVDRQTLGYPRQTIHGKVLGKGPPHRNPTPRRDPLSVSNPRGDGAFPGHYGEAPKPSE